jgi:hypothetical protein
MSAMILLFLCVQGSYFCKLSLLHLLAGGGSSLLESPVAAGTDLTKSGVRVRVDVGACFTV